MSGGFDIKDLNRVASTLAQGAQQFAGLSSSAPAIPDAGVSTGVVGNAISAFCDVMSKVTRTAANAADQAQSSSAGYDNTEHNNQASLGKIGGSR
jgi:hypothetical protein